MIYYDAIVNIYSVCDKNLLIPPPPRPQIDLDLLKTPVVVMFLLLYFLQILLCLICF